MQPLVESGLHIGEYIAMLARELESHYAGRILGINVTYCRLSKSRGEYQYQVVIFPNSFRDRTVSYQIITSTMVTNITLDSVIRLIDDAVTVQ
jgi:hypothetical protein